MNTSILYPIITKTRKVQSMDGMWKFKLDYDNKGKDEHWENGLSNYDMIPVPASFNDFYTDKDIREFTGDFWYETDVFVPDYFKGTHVDIRFGSVTHRCTVYVNGVEITSHEGGFLPFNARIDSVVKFNEMNKVVVKANNELSLTSLPVGETVTLKNGKKMTKPFFDFFNYAGIQRSVKLTSIPEKSIKDYETKYSLKNQDADIFYTVKADQDYTIKVELYDEENQLVTKNYGYTGVLHVENAHLWEVRNAYLYKLVIKLLDNDNTLLDEYEDHIGIRTFEIQDKKFMLNNHPVYLKGFGKHEDSDIIGRGFSYGVMKRDFELMKWTNANSFRTSHYPYSEEMYQMADREGFLIIDELPAVGLMLSYSNFIDAGTGKKVNDFFELKVLDELKEKHLKQLEELITRDKNHPSVIAWSLFNEPDSNSSLAYPYFKDIFDKAKELDPQRRPRTFAMILAPKIEEMSVDSLCDFLSLNRYYGWYFSGGYEMQGAKEIMEDEINRWIKKGTNGPIILTEYGCDHMQGLHKLPSVQWSIEYEKEYLDIYHEVFDKFDIIQGEQIWNFADFQTVEGILRVNGNKKGVFTRDRQPKETAYILKQRWEKM